VPADHVFPWLLRGFAEHFKRYNRLFIQQIAFDCPQTYDFASLAGILYPPDEDERLYLFAQAGRRAHSLALF